MRLSDINNGEIFKVINIPDEAIKSQAVRLGIFEGAVLKCSHKIEYGPVILEKHRQKIAVGYSIARKIEVSKNTNF